MGDMADWCFENEMIELARRELEIDDLVNAGVWVKADGVRIPISEMESGHIQNSINIINRKKLNHLKAYLKPFEEELSKRGES